MTRSGPPNGAEVLASGTRRAADDDPCPYLVLEVLRNARGGVVETAEDYLTRSPLRAGETGAALGAELGRMHLAVDPRAFGNFADAPGAERWYDDWAGYLSDFLAVHDLFVNSLGVTAAALRGAHELIGGCRYAERPRIPHGDISTRTGRGRRDRPARPGVAAARALLPPALTRSRLTLGVWDGDGAPLR